MLNEALLGIKNNIEKLCEIIESNTEYEGPLFSVYKEDILYFLCSLAIADDAVVMSEIQFINEMLDEQYNLLQIKRIGRNIDSQGYVVPKILEKSVEYELTDNGSVNSSQIIMNAFYYLGIEFIACDDDVDTNEIRVLTDLISNYQQYLIDNGLKFEMMDIVEDLRSREMITSVGNQLCANPKKKEPDKIDIPEYDALLTNLINRLDDKRFEKVRNSLLLLINNIRVRTIRKQRGLKNSTFSKTMILFGGDNSEIEAVADILSELFSLEGITEEKYVTRFLCAADPSGAERLNASLDMAKKGNVLILQADGLTKDEIDSVLKSMENNEHQAIFLSGDTNRLISFLQKNRQMNPKFNRSMYLEGLNPELICDIFEFLCVENDYMIDSSGKQYLKERYFREQSKYDPYYLFDVFDRVITFHNQRILTEKSLDSDKIMTITKEDVRFGSV